MKCSVIIIVFCIAVSLGEDVNVRLLSNQFRLGAQKVQAPLIEHGSPTQTFKSIFLEATEKYITQLVKSLYDQADHQASNFITAMEKISEDFDSAVGNIQEDCPSDFLDVKLKKVTKQLQVFLTLTPGNVLFKRRALPELPIQQSNITVMPQMRLMKDMFLNLAEIINRDLASMHGFINAMYLKGWENSRLSLNILQQQFRDEILNGSIMKAYVEAASKIYKDSELVQKYVKPETWQEFNEVSNRIILISNGVQKSQT